MKILVVNTLYAPNFVGGAERDVQALAEEWARLGHDVVVACVVESTHTRVEHVEGVKVYHVGLDNLYWPFGGRARNIVFKLIWHLLDTYNPFMAREIGKILDAEGADIINTNNLAGFSVAVWSLARKRDIAVVHALRDYYLMCPRASMFRRDRNCARPCIGCRVFSLVRRRLSRNVGAVVGISGFTLDRHLSDDFFPNAGQRLVSRNTYRPEARPATGDDVATRPLRLGYFGRLHPSKGVECLLAAFGRLPAASCVLLIGGSGTPAYETELMKKHGGPDVRFLGHRTPPEFFRSIDVLIVPSLWHEPLSRNIVEAYAHGVPAIVSNRGGLPEGVDHGITGFVYDPDLPGSLEESVLQFVNDRSLARRMRPAVLAKAHQHLPELVALEYTDLFRDVSKSVDADRG